MDRNALDWLFSTAPQAIAALVGLIFAGVSFINGKIDDRVDNDETLSDIAKEAKRQVYNGLKILITLTILGIIIDLLCVFLNPIETRKLTFSLSLSELEFSWYFTFAIFVFILNIGIICYALIYVIKIMNPDFFDNIIKEIANTYHEGVVDIAEFIKHFIEFEKVLRELIKRDYQQEEGSNKWSIPLMTRILVNNKIITYEERGQIININRLRNIVIHGGDVEKVDKKIDDELQKITHKLEEELS